MSGVCEYNWPPLFMAYRPITGAGVGSETVVGTHDEGGP